MKGKVDIPELVPVLEGAGIDEVRYRHRMPNATICYLSRRGRVIEFGSSHCHHLDQFCRRTGRTIALRRAIYNLNIKNRER